jgi:tRNA(Ile)-lysidine synthase
MKAKAASRHWRNRAERLAAAIPRSRLHPAVVAWADRRPAREPWAVAFSGGADSLSLLLLLWAHWPRRRRRLRALHFDHRLRGAASRADARFCARVGRALGVPVTAGAWPEPRAAASEGEARSARFAFFERAMRGRRIRVLWLGHQQDDIAESMLMRLARGSGTAGLAAPRPLQAGPSGRRHVRPLLDLKKAELIAALRAAGIPWREDASNVRADFFRNRIRRQVLPAWGEAAGRDALAGAAHARELLEEDDAALEAWVDALRPLTARGELALGRLAGRPRAVVRRALHRWLLAQPRAGDLSRRGFQELLAAVEAGRPGRRSLGAEGFAVIRGRRLRFEGMPARELAGSKRPRGA